MHKFTAKAASMKAKYGGDDDEDTSTNQFISGGMPVFSLATPAETSSALPLLSDTTSSKPTQTPGLPPHKEQPAPKEAKPEVVDQFLKQKDHISSTILADYASPLIHQECSCGKKGAICTTRCRDCFFYPPTCDGCFVEAHRRSPTHWAYKWQAAGGFFRKTDISSLDTDPFIQLGHNGNPCQSVYEDHFQHSFIIVDTNGVHSTRLRFCACHGCPSPTDQLLQARLFPATFEEPQTAFTFSVLKSYEAHHLESAESAYSFIMALRHLTDPLFYENVANPYDQFRNVYKMWRLAKTEQRLGHQHGIDDVLPSRPPGSLLVRCPTCPELGVNTEGTACPEPDLRSVLHVAVSDLKLTSIDSHLNQIRLTLDGNFRQNHLAKNPDSASVSFFENRAYFPDTEEYKAHLKGSSGGDEGEVEVRRDSFPSCKPVFIAFQKTECAFLKAVNKQDKKKFLGCDISGVVNVQCPHVFVLSSVDLELGEK
jgi:CxC2 like cysteine cluster associated with KDZ transposases/Kyakuja-Dileera-Zisupton transposase